MTDLGVNILASECRDSFGDDLEANLRMVMEKAKNHWMITLDEMRLKCAVAVTMLHYGNGSPEWERLAAEWRGLSKISHMLAGAHLGVVTEVSFELPEDFEPIGLYKIWKEVTGE